ncbi:MAG: phosphoribosylformylglycinamidine synthase subunit PurL [Saprospiraceae bacterium]|nr:phosphoribosylformylglycinamidine synthase subunit PurL [Saprospiraceae bacterium]MBK7736700.1 phosphoribosylformylglycinamidine synthase subunit PurL [Saprospiraceae bacterium]MBK7911937.1 phosphoribosylformylglycinamidine synthase subunit PurL [Saprospiraceae bacterium]
MSSTGLETAKKLGLLDTEYEKIVQVLGREPNFTELSIYSVMWSEHCSYKNSILQLKKLPRKGSRLLVEAGEENAGLVDIGDGLACAFKIESHNHPSAIEPYQGAATGVGGIHRDIFTMGARPIAALNSLRFGNLHNSHTKQLMKGVVKGIGNYGNSFGVPTVGGEVYFNHCYNQNILVNAMSVGIVEIGKTVSARADGPGNPVFIVGSATGKDGIHGATFASADLTEDSASDLPAVQVGDPFQEKLLLEASLEAIATGQIVGMQDMGAAGITCSTSEMSAKSMTGMRINLDLVPTRQKNMQAFEILLSESQERMLVVCKRGGEKQLLEVFDKWDLECVQIGEVTDTGRLEYFMHGAKIADVPAESLVLGGGAPIYVRESVKPAYFELIDAFENTLIEEPVDLVAVAKTLIASENIASKNWIYEQYDKMVRTGTMTSVQSADAALVRVKGHSQVLCLTTDCNSAYVYLDPHKGGMIAVSECARNISCSGGIPVAITNCLNFGNPYNPEVYWQFEHALKGMGEACLKFDTPVTGGNVSFYNQTVTKDRTEPVFPTPTIGMLGIMEDERFATTLEFKSEGDLIYVLGVQSNFIGYSEYLHIIHGITHAPAPHFDLEEEFLLHKTIQQLIRKSWVQSAHDISEGGLFCCLAESCFSENQKGFFIEIPETYRKDIFLFGENQGRAVLTIKPENKAEFELFLQQNGQKFHYLGEVTKGELVINEQNFGSTRDYFELYSKSISNQF